MRWFWIDRFSEFEPGKRAVAIKNVTLAEEHLHDHFPGYPCMPGSLMIEGLAQTGGLLLAQTDGFGKMVVLAKVPKMKFHGVARPGDSLRYEAILEDERPEGGMVSCRATCEGRLLAEGEIMFARIETAERWAGGEEQRRLLSMLGFTDSSERVVN